MTTLDARFVAQFGSFALDAAFTVPLTGVTSIFGPSGSGKTSLLNCIAGLVRPTVGTLSVGDEIWQDKSRFLPAYQRRVGYVFQGGNLFAHLSVENNLRYGEKRRARTSSAISFTDVVTILGLAPLLDRLPLHLSGGERQRVAIGRALLAHPALLLLDEPLSGLDHASRREILLYLERLSTETSIPMILVSHDLSEVIRLADRIIRLEAGKVTGVAPLAESLVNLDLPFSASADASALLTATALDYDAENGLTLLDAGGVFQVPGREIPRGRKLRLRLFASDVALSRESANNTTILNRLPGRIVSTVPYGPYQMTVRLSLGTTGDGSVLLARVTRKSWQNLAFAPGQPVWILVKAVSLVDP